MNHSSYTLHGSHTAVAVISVYLCQYLPLITVTPSNTELIRLFHMQYKIIWFLLDISYFHITLEKLNDFSCLPDKDQCCNHGKATSHDPLFDLLPFSILECKPTSVIHTGCVVYTDYTPPCFHTFVCTSPCWEYSISFHLVKNNQIIVCVKWSLTGWAGFPFLFLIDIFWWGE